MHLHRVGSIDSHPGSHNRNVGFKGTPGSLGRIYIYIYMIYVCVFCLYTYHISFTHVYIYICISQISHGCCYLVSRSSPQKKKTSEDVNETGYLIVGAQGRTASWWQLFFWLETKCFCSESGSLVYHLASGKGFERKNVYKSGFVESNWCLFLMVQRLTSVTLPNIQSIFSSIFFNLDVSNANPDLSGDSTFKPSESCWVPRSTRTKSVFLPLWPINGFISL